jgi:hypothetical protein
MTRTHIDCVTCGYGGAAPRGTAHETDCGLVCGTCVAYGYSRVRPCEAGCGRSLSITTRRHARTCSQRCRKALSRKNRSIKKRLRTHNA